MHHNPESSVINIIPADPLAFVQAAIFRLYCVLRVVSSSLLSAPKGVHYTIKQGPGYNNFYNNFY